MHQVARAVLFREESSPVSRTQLQQSALSVTLFRLGEEGLCQHPVREPAEVASLLGDVAEGLFREPAVHAHLVVGKRDDTALAGPSTCVAHARNDCDRKPGTFAQGSGS